MKKKRFEELVDRALNSLPDEFSSLLDNVGVFIAGRPSEETLREMKVPKGETLFGLYEGVPLTERTSEYGLVVPDTITLFQDSIEEACNSEAEMAEQIRKTVLHELAHHFGIDEERMDEIEARWDDTEAAN
ncbi:MAG: metallopeptidase family protein [Dehalococcoidia bacterium]|nr:metallopeptidase family protein [Dehalococcoidia bacterium]